MVDITVVNEGQHITVHMVATKRIVAWCWVPMAHKSNDIMWLKMLNDDDMIVEKNECDRYFNRRVLVLLHRDRKNHSDQTSRYWTSVNDGYNNDDSLLFTIANWDTDLVDCRNLPNEQNCCVVGMWTTSVADIPWYHHLQFLSNRYPAFCATSKHFSPI